MAGLTFLQLQNELILVAAARFKETQRASIQFWLNDRAQELWGLENWTFRQASTTFSVTSGSATATAPSDIGIVRGVWNPLGDRLTHIEPGDYYDTHLSPSVITGTPDSYTVINKQVLLDPTPSASSSAYRILYTRGECHLDANANYIAGPMTADTDKPALPTELHYALVHGATASGAITVNDFTYQFAEQRWSNAIASMRQNYLADVRGELVQWGSAY